MQELKRKRNGNRLLEQLGLLVGLGLIAGCLCSCSSLPSGGYVPVPGELPEEIALIPDVGRGGHLVLNVRMEGGGTLPMMLDTGAPETLLASSLEPQLGKKYGTQPVQFAGKPKVTGGIYGSPKLYLGKTRLAAGPHVTTYDFGGAVMGILGMDCMKHYIIQLDVQAGKLRFLNASHLKGGDLGVGYPLTFKGNYPCLRRSNLDGEDHGPLLLDLGCSVDGLIDAGPERSESLQGQYWPEGRWGGNRYTDLILARVEHGNVLGLRFLARHLVTFDFPGKMVYLKLTSAGPQNLKDGSDWLQSPRYSALQFLLGLKRQKQLPGWTVEGHGALGFNVQLGSDGNAVTYAFWVQGEADRHWYRVERAGTAAPWKLTRAWLSDEQGRQLAEYVVP